MSDRFEPVSFPEVNNVVSNGETDIEVYSEEAEEVQLIVSCWRPSFRQILALLLSRRIWMVQRTAAHAPTYLSHRKPAE